MSLHWLKRKLRSFRTDAVRLRRARLYRARPRVEALEPRLAPVTNSWIGGNADWSVAADWSQNHTPLSGEDVAIGNGATVTHSTGSDTVNSITVSGGSTLTLSGGTITDASTLDASGGSSHFRLAGGTLTGATVTAGTTITGT